MKGFIARTLMVSDLFLAMIVSSVLIGVFCGMSTVEVHKLKEVILNNNTTRVDYYRNREILIGCIVIGVSFCGTDIMMAVGLDFIITKRQSTACVRWLLVACVGLLFRNLFYLYLWKNMEYLGLTRMDDFTSGVDTAMRILFKIGVAYEVVKAVKIIVGLAVQRDIARKKIESIDQEPLSIFKNVKPTL